MGVNTVKPHMSRTPSSGGVWRLVSEVVTLNLTLLTPGAIYQSADFRLVDADSNQPLTLDSMKLVTVHYFRWEGLITYTGIGRWRNRDTSDWIIDWLTGLEDAQPTDIVNRLTEGGTRFLKSIERSSGTRQPHTFVFAAFLDAGPTVWTISNFEGCEGRADDRPAAQLRVDSRTAAHDALLLVTGLKAAVPRASRRRIQRLASESGTSPAQIRYALTETTVEAARAPEAHGSISASCSVVSLSRDGSGFQDLTQGTAARPRSVMNGLALPDPAEMLGQPLGVVRGISYTRAAPDQERQSHPPCVPQVVVPEEAGGFELTELRVSEFEASTAWAVNAQGLVLGRGTRTGQPGIQLPCTWTPDGSSALIGVTGTVTPQSLNNNGEVCLTADMEDGSVHAARWATGQDPHDLGTIHGRESDEFADSGATAISESGVVVGWVSVSRDPQDRGQPHYRPAAWFPGRDGIFLTDFVAAWGQAVDVNQQGVVLVVGYMDDSPGAPCKAFLWDPLADRYDAVAGEQPDNVYPICITTAGRILGSARGRAGEAIAGISSDGGSWERLGTPDGWYATSMSESGDVAGALVVEGFERPWCRRADGVVTWLPFFRHHYCRPASIAGDLIVGNAQTDHGTHALLWVYQTQ